MNGFTQIEQISMMGLITILGGFVLNTFIGDMLYLIGGMSVIYIYYEVLYDLIDEGDFYEERYD